MMSHVLNRFNILYRFLLALDCKTLFVFLKTWCTLAVVLRNTRRFTCLVWFSKFLLNPNVCVCVFESGPRGIAQDFQSLICTPERVRCGWPGSRGSPGSVAVQTPSLLEVRVKIMCLFSVTGNRHSMMANKCFETEQHKELICIKWLHYTVF